MYSVAASFGSNVRQCRDGLPAGRTFSAFREAAARGARNCQTQSRNPSWQGLIHRHRFCGDCQHHKRRTKAPMRKHLALKREGWAEIFPRAVESFDCSYATISRWRSAVAQQSECPVRRSPYATHALAQLNLVRRESTQSTFQIAGQSSIKSQLRSEPSRAPS